MILMEDRALLDAFRRGDEAALLRIYRHYNERLRGMLRAGFTFTSVGQTFRFRGYSDSFEVQDILQHLQENTETRAWVYVTHHHPNRIADK